MLGGLLTERRLLDAREPLGFFHDRQQSFERVGVVVERDHHAPRVAIDLHEARSIELGAELVQFRGEGRELVVGDVAKFDVCSVLADPGASLARTDDFQDSGQDRM